MPEWGGIINKLGIKCLRKNTMKNVRKFAVVLGTAREGNYSQKVALVVFDYLKSNPQ